MHPSNAPRAFATALALLAGATAGCEDEPAPAPLSRLEPLLRGDPPHVVAPLPDDEGFVLTISPSEMLAEPTQAGVTVHAADGRAIPYHLFDCHDIRERTLDRSPAVEITPGTVRFCHLFVPSAAEVDRIVLHPAGRDPVDLYRDGDPLGPTPGVVVKPPVVEHRLPGTVGVVD